jgi:translation initiation factor 6
MTHLLKLSIHQNPNIGLLGVATDTVCLLGMSIPKRDAQKIEKVLKVPVIRTNICGTSLVGAFVVGNNKRLLLPQITFKSELEKLDKHNVHYHILKTDHTALGNNIVTTDDACLISPELESKKNEIRKMLGVQKIKTMEIDDIQTIGALLAINGKGCLLSALATRKQEEAVAKLFSIPVTRGTVNLGSPYIRSGIIVNNHGFVFGKKTGGPEAVAIDRALGFLE